MAKKCGEAVYHRLDEFFKVGSLQVVVKVLVFEQALQMDGGLFVSTQDFTLFLNHV